MSRLIITTVIFLSLVMSSCGNTPQSDGEKAAKAFNECEENYRKSLNEKTQEFISEFETYNFSSREEAREKYNEITNEAEREYKENLNEAQMFYETCKGKYINKPLDAERFETSFSLHKKQYENLVGNAVPFANKVNEKILSIIPETPSIEQIKQDLVGRSVQDNKDGYFGTSPHEIEKGSVKDIKIISQTKNKNEYVINAIISIQDRVGSAVFNVNADIKYILGNEDEWMLDYLGSNSIEIVKTGNCEKYIKTYIQSEGSENVLYINNQCDATLIVGGIISIGYGNNPKREKFSILIKPNSTQSIGGIFFGNVQEYEIHFVERR